MVDKNEILKKKFSERLKGLMDENGETSRSVGEVVHMSGPTISRYVTGQMAPKIPTIESLAKHFNVNPTWLMGLDTPKKLSDVKEPTSDTFALKVKGHSMEPRIFDGDIVIVRKQDDIESGEISVVEVEGTATTKKVVKQENGLLLIGLNTAAFPPRFYPYSEVKIIGKVIEVRGKLDEWNK